MKQPIKIILEIILLILLSMNVLLGTMLFIGLMYVKEYVWALVALFGSFIPLVYLIYKVSKQ